MATAVRSIIGEVSTGTWDNKDGGGDTTPHWDCVNEDPDAPTDTDYIETTTDTDVIWLTLDTASLPANYSSGTSVQVDLRGYLSDAGATADVDVELYTNTGALKLGATYTIDVGAGGGQWDAYGTTLSNASVVFGTPDTTNFPINKTQAEDLRLKITFQAN